MAEAITYADLRFVKAPLKNSISSCLEQDPDFFEDGELTYENVQVSPVPSAPAGLASSGLGDKAGVKSEPPTTHWGSVKSPAARRILRCSKVCLEYFLLGLSLACLLFGVAAICLGVRYLQVSQQLEQMTEVLEDTNGTLWQQLHLQITQLGQKDQDLQEWRRKLQERQDELEEAQKNYQDTKKQLQTCQSEEETTRETLKREEEQRRVLSQRLTDMQEREKSYLKCSSDTCCPLGWTLYQGSCLHVSPTKKNWQQSRIYCLSLSSSLAKLGKPESSYIQYPSPNFRDLLSYHLNSYWIGQWENRGSSNPRSECPKIEKTWSSWSRTESPCSEFYHCICELAALRFLQRDYSLH